MIASYLMYKFEFIMILKYAETARALKSKISAEQKITDKNPYSNISKDLLFVLWKNPFDEEGFEWLQHLKKGIKTETDTLYQSVEANYATHALDLTQLKIDFAPNVYDESNV